MWLTANYGSTKIHLPVYLLWGKLPHWSSGPPAVPKNIFECPKTERVYCEHYDSLLSCHKQISGAHCIGKE